MNPRILIRYSLLACGWIALAVGAIGIIVPVLPTAPFVLLAAACFMRSSERLHTWSVEHPVFGPHIKDFLAGRGLRRRAKVMALSTLWLSVAVSTVFFVPMLIADMVIVATALGVSAYLLRLPTCPAEA